MQPRQQGLPLTSNRPYSGCNVILLWLARDRGWPTSRFLTFRRAIEAGGNVRKGEQETGLRSSALVALRGEQVDFNTAALHVRDRH